jgi:hypothetical protein
MGDALAPESDSIVEFGAIVDVGSGQICSTESGTKLPI